MLASWYYDTLKKAYKLIQNRIKKYIAKRRMKKYTSIQKIQAAARMWTERNRYLEYLKKLRDERERVEQIKRVNQINSLNKLKKKAALMIEKYTTNVEITYYHTKLKGCLNIRTIL
jgi:hypothetical protein